MRVELKDSESFDQLLRRFTKGIERSGIIREHRRGLRFISVQEENRAKRRKAERRRRRNAAAYRRSADNAIKRFAAAGLARRRSAGQFRLLRRLASPPRLVTPG